MNTKQVKIGNAVIGGGARPLVQSMATEKTERVSACVEQILRLEDAGCEIIRVAVLDEKDAYAISEVKKQIRIPLVADIHFSARLAVLAVEAGADKLRINPGNIGGEKEIKLVSDCVKAHKIPVRVGANTGSIEPHFRAKYGVSANALVESALYSVNMLEKNGVNDLVLAVKASSVPLTVEAYRLLAGKTQYPLHIGVTEAGTFKSGLIKSSAGIGALLLDGIGDTLRVSLSADPVEEALAGHEILRAVGIEKNFVEVVACPTCGRCEYPCMELAEKVARRVGSVRKSLKVAVMGCVVNGPGEAKECDLGIAGSKEYCVLFEKGEITRRVPVEEAENAFFQKLEELIG